MKNRALWTLVAAAVSFAPLRAHHSFAAEFDDKQPVVLKGVVSKFEMAMPHSYVYVDVAGEKGKSNWAIGLSGNPNSLMRAGWTKNTLKPGMEITVKGWRAKDGTNKAQDTSVQLADGTMVLKPAPARQTAAAK